MLPDDKIMCHRTAFTVSCFDGVTKHKCRLWCHVSGTDAKGADIDVFGCGDELSLKFLHEIAKEERQTAASVDKVATEVRNAADTAAAGNVYLVNGIRASFPVLRLLEQNNDAERLADCSDQPSPDAADGRDRTSAA